MYWDDTVWPAWIKRVIALESVDSTNNLALQLAREERAAEGTLVVAEAQSAGRGRHDRFWFSPPGSSIYMSLILRPLFSSTYAQIPTLITAAATAAAIQHLYRLPARVKWPNDIQLGHRKVGGILTEASLGKDHIDFLVVGLGVNCNMDSSMWPCLLQGSAVSIAEMLGSPVDRKELLLTILRILEKDYQLCRLGHFDDALRGWRNLSSTLGTIVKLQTSLGILQGHAADILPDGKLRIVDAASQTPVDVSAGEVISVE